MTLVRIGYWRGVADRELPDPRDFVDPNWDEDERFEVALHLRQGAVARRYMGKSTCRLCGAIVGALELSDGRYLWPEGLGHYVSEHQVRLPQPFIDHVAQVRDALETADVDDTWWIKQMGSGKADAH